MRACILAVVCLVACVQPSKVVGVACGSSGDCSVGGVAGTCESTGFCSYPDAACTGGQRYSPGAGDGLGNTCVGGDLACGALGQACCTSSLCGTNLECDGASTTCVCGGEGQTCCVGQACASNLACGDGRCDCGAIGEPCCGGATCDTGVTCTAGTCEAGSVAVGVGMGHACVVRTDRSVWCWGGDYRPFGESIPNFNYPFVGGLPHRVAAISDVTSLGSSEFSVCARKQDGTVWCWGHGESGQLGDGTTVSRKEAAQVPGLTGVTMLEGGRFHECAVGAFNGTQGVWCWGRGGQGGRSGTANPALGRLGNNDIVDSSTPVAVDLSAAASAGQTVRDLSVGSYHSCVVMSDNTVWCWGRGDNGQLGTGLTDDTKVPAQVSLASITIAGGVTIDQVACSDGNNFSSAGTCMLLSDGAAYCWGTSTLGDGTNTQRNAPTTAVDLAALAGDKPIELRAGFQVQCVRTMANDLWCWGRNKAGVLGTGVASEAAVLTPAKVLNVSNVLGFDLGHRTACAVDSSERLMCWGNNFRGQILGGDARVHTPVEVRP